MITAGLSVEVGTKTKRRALFWLLELEELEADTVTRDKISDECFLERIRVDFNQVVVSLALRARMCKIYAHS